jgi:HD superfamily phosphohydrolase
VGKGNAESKKVWVARLSSNTAPAVEALLSARDLAYRRIYYHKTHRCAVSMMVLALESITQTSSKDKYEMALLTDEQLLDLFEEGTPFTKDVANRIRLRRVYEPLPFEIHLQRHFGDEAYPRLSELIRPKTMREYQSIVDFTNQLSRDIGLPDDSKIIIDLKPIPISKKSAYVRDYFLDEVGNTSKSLVDILPHLNILHGVTSEETGQDADHHEHYSHEISRIL